MIRISYLGYIIFFQLTNILQAVILVQVFFILIKAGCIFHFINSEKIAYKGNPEDVNRDHPQENVFMVNQIYKIFSNQEDEITQEKLSLTDSFLNTEYLISPFQLKLLFIISEPLFFFLRLKHKFW